METIALELVPPDLDAGPQQAVEEAHKVLENSKAAGIGDRIRHVMMPGMIAEDDDRPIPMKPKMDVLDFWNVIQPELAPINGICTQVTAFSEKPQLTQRFSSMLDAGIDGIVFVGVPRTMADGEGSGMDPTDALDQFSDLVPNRGAILIPTREGEQGRFSFKCDRGATFGMTQLLYSDAIVGFLREFAKQTPHRPELLLSFGFVPKAESRVEMINWLIQDPGNPEVRAEQEFVAELAELPFAEKKRQLVGLYKKVIEGVGDLGFPMSVHLEAPYGVTKPAFEAFAEMLDFWAPGQN